MPLKTTHPEDTVLYNVSVLLGESLGSSRQLAVEEQFVTVADEGYETTVSGDVTLFRTDRGILVQAKLLARPQIECGRCLKPFTYEHRLKFDEEFVLPSEPGADDAIEAGPDDFSIDESQHLDVSEAVRQYEQSVLPIRPMCRPDCAGLCSTCGQDLNEGTCGCPKADLDERWTSLAGLSDQLKTEEASGSTQA